MISTITLLALVVFFGIVLMYLGLQVNEANVNTLNLLEKSDIRKQIQSYGGEDSVSWEDMAKTDNITGSPTYVVPNLVHYIMLDTTEIIFSHFVSILSVLKNQQPDQILIHCNCDELTGNYYKKLMRVLPGTKTTLQIRRINKPTSAFGMTFRQDYQLWHAGDLLRILVLIKFGGIYLDQDVYVVKSLNEFRKFEMTIGWDDDVMVASQLLIARKNARFLSLWKDTYHDYNGEWYFVGQVTSSILLKHPELVHRVKKKFGSDGHKLCPILYTQYYQDWEKDFYAIHLLLRGHYLSHKRWCFKTLIGPFIPKLDEATVQTLGVTFGEMAVKLFTAFPGAFNETL